MGKSGLNMMMSDDNWGILLGCRLLAQCFQSISSLDRTLRMNSRQRINALLTHWATLPVGINDRGVAILGKYHGHLVCEHSDGRFYELAQTDLWLDRIAQQAPKKRGFFGSSVDGLGRPMSATGLHDTLGDSAS